MSQAAASVDACVPTPGSVAEVLSQQALPDSGPEAKPDFKDQDEDSSSGKKQPDFKMVSKSPQESRRLSLQSLIQSLEHACQCRNCSLPSCQKMKRVVQHTKGCKRKNNGSCPVCKQLIAPCVYHAKHCQENKCPVPFCPAIKHKLLLQRLQRLQQRLQQARMMRQRMATPPRGA